jgi:hypothetical protein
MGKEKKSMAEKDYGHRDIVDKLNIRPGYAVVFACESGEIDIALHERVVDRAGRPPALEDEAVDVILVSTDAATDFIEVLMRWRLRLKPTGGIWLLTPKRGQPGYVDQRELIAAGLQAGVVDNKSCSVSPTVSAMRFVIRKRDR